MRCGARQSAITCRLKVLAAAMAAIAIAFIPYRPVLGYFFTGTDTFTLIETSRAESSEDLARILLKPLMWGSDFTDRARFYRPTAALSYSLDYRLWKLNPFGYHLTNMALHLLTVILILLMVRELTNGDLSAGLCSALIFAVHPILAETVPALDYRHDIIAGCFLLVSFLLFLKGRRRHPAGKAFIVFSVLSYFMALGAKETAIVLPGIVFSYLLIVAPATSWKTRLGGSLRGTAPYLCAGAAYLVWRVHLLGGLGGYVEPYPGLQEFLLRMQQIVVLYTADLVYPHDFLAVFDVIPKGFVAPALLIFPVLWLILCVGRSADPTASRTFAHERKLVLFLIWWLLLPLGVFIVTSTFNHRSMYTCAIPYAALVGLFLTISVRRLKGLVHSGEPLSSTSGAIHKYPLPEGEGASGFGLLKNVKPITNRCTGLYPKPMAHAALPILIVALGLIAGHVFCSPLLRNYNHWHDSSRMTSFFLNQLIDPAATFNINSTIEVENLPSFITRYESQIPRARDVGYLNDYGIKSWLNLHSPDNRMKVVVLSRFSPETAPRRMHVDVRSVEAHTVRLRIEYPGIAGRCFPQPE
ncbi:MAG: hypothetical protein RDU20_13555 [Desulfomonilaceae bacterium]|nr:hypothetical protein [Desulfomonilaceae bacterium]